MPKVEVVDIVQLMMRSVNRRMRVDGLCGITLRILVVNRHAVVLLYTVWVRQVVVFDR
jgi:hypothetical protein